MKINVDFDISRVVRWVDGLTNHHLDAAAARALNRVADQAKTRMIREISSEFMVSTSYVRERLVVRRASAAAGRFVLQAALEAKDRKRSINLIAFAEKVVSLAQARKRRAAGEGKGGRALELRFKIKRVGAKQVIKGAFIGNRGRTVFVREGSGRLPIKALQTINVPQMFNTKRLNERVVAFVKQQLPVRLRHELGRALNR